MPDFEIALSLLVAVALIVTLSRRLAVAYPILLVIGGVALGVVIALLPGVPNFRLEPDLVFVVLLPPLIFAAAWETPIRDIRQNVEPVLLLSVGLVLFTTAVVGLAGVVAIPGLTLATALVLGAIVSPSDALAATTVLSHAPVPRRVRAVLEEESLLNDATALVAYRTAVTAAVSGSFAVSTAVSGFAIAAFGGLAIGLVVAVVVGLLWERLDDPPVEVTLSLVIPYAAYLPAERVGASGVIAAVTVGLLLGYRSSRILSPETRVLAGSVWQIVSFVLNGFAFLLVGLELPAAIAGLGSRPGIGLAYAAIVVSVAVVAARFAWVYLALHLPRAIAHRVLAVEGPAGRSLGIVVSWAGMRGAISLAAALALPVDFPERNLILLLTFAVIAVTLLGQGLTLPILLRRMSLPADEGEIEEETLARTRTVEAALSEIDRMRRKWPGHLPLIATLEDRYHHELDHLPEPDEQGTLTVDEARTQERLEHHAILNQLIGAEREAVIHLRDSGDIGDEILRRVERELDLEELQLQSML